jgi:hypothetical protein
MSAVLPRSFLAQQGAQWSRKIGRNDVCLSIESAAALLARNENVAHERA